MGTTLARENLSVTSWALCVANRQGAMSDEGHIREFLAKTGAVGLRKHAIVTLDLGGGSRGGSEAVVRREPPSYQKGDLTQMV